MSRPSFIAMLEMLGPADAKTAELAKKIEGMEIRMARLEDDALELGFSFGLKVLIFDDGQCCCENRYMTCDDDLDQFIGSVVQSIEIADGPEVDCEYDYHDTAFLRVNTDRGSIVACTHNEHNGYYGGFIMRIREAR